MSAKIADMLVWYLVFVFSTTFHEFSHAFLAFKGGDSTAYETGHVTLDPTPHIKRSPIGMVLVPLFTFWQLGWMVGFASVPFNAEWGRKNPRRQALMSLAGPMANLLLALIALGALRGLLAAHVFQFTPFPSGARFVEAVGGAPRSPLNALALGLGVMLELNIVLFLFNLLPVPPLDGAGVIAGLWPTSIGALYERMRRFPGFEFLGLLIAWRVFPYLATPVVSAFVMLLYR